MRGHKEVLCILFLFINSISLLRNVSSCLSLFNITKTPLMTISIVKVEMMDLLVLEPLIHLCMVGLFTMMAGRNLPLFDASYLPLFVFSTIDVESNFEASFLPLDLG